MILSDEELRQKPIYSQETLDKAVDCAISQTRQDTLREVGEWLETRQVYYTSPTCHFTNAFITELSGSDIEALKRGVLPEQSGTKEEG